MGLLLLLGSAAPAVSAPENWEAYRYLRVVIRSVGSANQPFTVGLGSKTWSGTTDTDGTWKTYDFDLCCPHNTAATTDAQDTRFPLTGYAGDPTTEGELWGVNAPNSVDFSNLANGKTYEIDSIELRRASWAHASFLPEFWTWLSWYGTKSVKRQIFSDTDGRSGLEIPYIEEDGGIYTHWSIADAVAEANLIPGWTATLAGSYGDSYHDSGGLAAWIGAEGSIYRSGSWHDQVDVDFTSAADVYAQPLFDVVFGYPHIYDPWEGGGYSGSFRGLPVRFTKFLRGRAWGLGFTTANVPFDGAKVIAYRSGPVSAGQDTCDTRGFYQTGLSYGKGDVSHTTEFQAGVPPFSSLSNTWENRRKERSSFRVDAGSIPSDGNVSYEVSDANRHTVAFVGLGSELYIATSPNTYPLKFDPAVNDTTPIVCDWCCIRYMAGRDNKLYLWTEESGTVYQRTSTDEGKTFTVSTSIATGSKPCAVITRDNLVMVYWIDGTAIKGRIYDAAGTLLEATFTAVASGVDDKGIACDERVLQGGKRQIVLWYVASGTLTAVYAYDGKTFS